MNELWKIWRLVSPREGALALGVVMLASLMIHLIVMFGSDRYIDRLLG
ncbi:MAG: light-harvesting protein [Pseudomonadota bacterium]